MSDQTEDTGKQEPPELRESNPNAGGDERAAGQMGVSSERVGPVGGGPVGTDGGKDTSAERRPDHGGDWVGSDAGGAAEAETPEAETPEARAQEPEENPAGLGPKAGYPSLDPRSADRPYRSS